jgi:protein-S-isoprenylcysteine O-methyltransferase Ste14
MTEAGKKVQGMGKKYEDYSFFERRRKVITASFLVIGVFIILFTRHTWPVGAAGTVFTLSGAALILAGLSGRLWSTMYIGGKKNTSLVTLGPYSMCRNPLYFFSFLAGLGISMVFKNLLLIALYLVVFSFLYPLVIKSEEKRLHKFFGDVFLSYKSSTPAFIPNVLRLKFGESSGLPTGRLWKTFLDGSIFLMFIPLAYLIARLQESGALPTFWSVP